MLSVWPVFEEEEVVEEEEEADGPIGADGTGSFSADTISSSSNLFVGKSWKNVLRRFVFVTRAACHIFFSVS